MSKWKPLLVLFALSLPVSACDAGATTDAAPAGSGGGVSTGSSGARTGGAPTLGGHSLAMPVPPEVFDPGEGGGAEPRSDGERAEALPSPECPEVEPEEEGACERAGLNCSYGDSPRWECRRSYRCESALAWHTIDRGDCNIPPASACPEQPTPGSSCVISDASVDRESCSYGSTVCQCCTPGTRSCPFDFWVCLTPPENLDCPEFAPNLGDGCAKQAARCVYGVPCVGTGTVLFCRGGAWEEEAFSCIP